MLNVKIFEIRDVATTIPAMAFRFAHYEDSPIGVDEMIWLLERAGFGQRPTDHRQYTFLMRLEDAECHYDVYEWRGGARTMPEAHKFISRNWSDLNTGDIIDIEFILGETSEKKTSDRKNN